MKTKDRATQYAMGVASGKIMAGPHVRNACKRHLRDLENAAERGFRYDGHEANESIAFFEECLYLNGGQFDGKPFLLADWQSFIVGSIFGWKRVDGTRRFRVAYIEAGKGTGKSPMCAGIGIKGLVADGEARAEIYAAATHKDQAKVLFRDALAFYDQSPELQARLIASGTGDNRWNLAYPDKGSFFRVISSENKGKSGPRPHMALLDEVHEHKDGTVIEMLRAGFKFRRQPLSVMITNSGHDKTTVCWEYHELGAKVCAGTVENDELFAYICALDDEDLKDDRYLDDESVWPKVNPSLYIGIPGYDYIRGQVNEARGLPSKMSTVKRLNFCVWTEAENPWISSDVWFGCRDESFDCELEGRKCWGGLDLSSTQDLTAAAWLFEPTEDDPVWRLKVKFWIPGDGLRQKEDKDRVPYLAWRDAGHIDALPGKATDKTAVLHYLVGCTERYNVQTIAYDRWRIEDITMAMAKDGISLPLAPFGQGFKDMGPAVDKMETMLLEKQVMHDGNPVLTWCAANAVIASDPAGNRKIAKDRATGRVDGIVAAIMACGVMKHESQSVYEQRGILAV